MTNWRVGRMFLVPGGDEGIKCRYNIVIIVLDLNVFKKTPHPHVVLSPSYKLQRSEFTFIRTHYV